VVGLADTPAPGMRERVQGRLAQQRFRVPLTRVIVQLAASRAAQKGPAFDLPIGSACCWPVAAWRRSASMGFWSAANWLERQPAGRCAGDRPWPWRHGAAAPGPWWCPLQWVEALLVEGLTVWPGRAALISVEALLADPRRPLLPVAASHPRLCRA